MLIVYCELFVFVIVLIQYFIQILVYTVLSFLSVYSSTDNSFFASYPLSVFFSLSLFNLSLSPLTTITMASVYDLYYLFT